MDTTATQIDVVEQANNIADMVTSSDVFDEYKQAKANLRDDKQVMEKIAQFQTLKEKYEEVQRFGKYHPDFDSISKEVREKKRELDTYPLVAEFKRAEKELDELLTDISQKIAYAVSPFIKVPTGNPFFDQAGCSGGCGSGGSCGCS
ncbi:cell fate (sporulation/competence/biofilm development) regulator YlbF (YheA/YmcA/DUF963 family) [Texcoconibacillus texcoconensis]|uniref:Cell fate (Sporulation/competence/biofilm development) regulator YlbF (YheA/YmcA/DUF963 family) n=2 Tax=Texcoconibacillus texcoconensis TaxID=1095777 RepID=A0A840QLF3_9BACI|nr:YlbF family regulator [Texcoconibacillus texcoconensis]MBB5172199.1 cell fate (sporulation/competence/biofilm development) regulator YlbF (YheA/YmcA/DUF963 family) [Texcoconibacillus texcoconensis]